MRSVLWMIPALVFGLNGISNADEKEIEVYELPKAVIKAAKKAFPKAKIVAAAKEKDEEDETIFEVMMKLDGKSIDLAIDEEGEIEEVEKEIEVEDLPSAVVKSAKQAFPKAKIKKVEEVSDEDDKVVYEVSFELKGKMVEVAMSPNGKILDRSEDEDDDEDDKPKAKKKDKDDDEDDKPKAKKKDKDDDEDEDDE